MRILFFLLFPLQLFSQDLEGVWTGSIYNDTTHKYIPYEIAISDSKGKLSGFSHTIFTGENNIQETGIKTLKIKKKSDKILIEDDELIFNNYKEAPPKGVKQYSVLNVMASDTGLMLVGVFNTNRTKEYSSLTGTVQLKKKEKVKETKLVAKLEELKLSDNLSFIKPPEKDVAVVTNEKPGQVKLNPDIKNDIQTKPSASNSNIAAVNNFSSENKTPIVFSEDMVDYSVTVINNKETASDKKPGAQKIEKIKTPIPEKQLVQVEKIIPAALTEEEKISSVPLVKTKAERLFVPNRIPVFYTKVIPRKIDVKLPAIKTIDPIAFQAPVTNESNKMLVKQADIKTNSTNEPLKKPEIKLPVEKTVVAVKQTNPEIIKPEIKNNTNPETTKKPEIKKPVEKQVVAVKQPENVVVKQEIKSNEKNPETKQPVIPVTKPVQQSTVPLPTISAEDLAKRKIETIRSVEFEADSLVLTLYDNGEIDGDIVSVILNGKVVMPKQLLTAKALTKTIYITPDMGDSLQLILYAENLGSIAPNTGLLLIKDAAETYQIRFSGDLQKNAAIILRRKHK